jgi:hypothetical protein
MEGMEPSDKLAFRRQPTSADFNAVHEAIAFQEKAIASLDGEIDALMRNVRRLTHQKSQHYARIRQWKGLITLATRIPSELLATIFEHAASDFPRAPLIVSHVCSAWRAAATLPGVWSHIYVNCDSRVGPCDRMRFWLSRAQEAPLHITLEVAADGSHLERVMDLLLGHAHQWRSLTINTLFSSQANYILSRCGRPTPELRRIDIRTDLERRDADQVEEQLVGFKEAFKDAPCLSTIHLARELSPTIYMPERITSLFIHLPSWSGPSTLSAISVIQLLEGLPLLQQFTLEFPMYHERSFVYSTEESRIASMPYLESLSLVLSPDVNGILKYIHAPNLRRLLLRSSGEPLGYAHTSTGTSLVQFIEQSSPPLEHLELHDVDLPRDDFTRIFAISSNLKELRLHESEIDDDIIHLLDGPAGFCPHLSQLDLRWCGQLTGQALVDLVRSRAGQLDGVIVEVTALNCSFVKENDIMDLASITKCRVIMRPNEDICR